MTREEFDDIKKAVCGLEYKELRLRSQRQRLEERLIGQTVEWTRCDGVRMTGVVFPHNRHYSLDVMVGRHRWTPALHQLRFVEEVPDGG